MEQKNDIIELRKQLDCYKLLLIRQSTPRGANAPDMYEVHPENAEIIRKINGTKETYKLVNIEIDFDGIKDGSNLMR